MTVDNTKSAINTCKSVTNNLLHCNLHYNRLFVTLAFMARSFLSTVIKSVKMAILFDQADNKLANFKSI